jgi:hypothetical protein
LEWLDIAVVDAEFAQQGECLIRYDELLFAFWSSDDALLIGWWILLASAIMLAIGWHSRVGALLIFVLIVSLSAAPISSSMPATASSASRRCC